MHTHRQIHTLTNAVRCFELEKGGQILKVWLVLHPLTSLFDDVFILILVGRHTLGVLIVISCQFGSKTTTKGLPGEFFLFVFPSE